MPTRDDLQYVLAALPIDREPNPHVEKLAHVTQPAELADYLKAGRAALFAPLLSGAGVAPPVCGGFGLAMAHELSDLMDAVISRMFEISCLLVGANPLTLPVSVVATGGYGRQELCPFSDIDVTFIPQRDGDAAIDRVIREMFRQVMDICIARCGLEVGYAYRLMEDCASLDHQTACGLLDARLITGSKRLFIQFEDAYWMGFNATDFIFEKLAEREKLLAKWGLTPRVVEPNLKEGPGGLRDFQTAIWLVQARTQLVAARVRGERAINVLMREAEVSAADATRLTRAKERLFEVRNALHLVTGTERDDLVITRQEDVAARLGYVTESRRLHVGSDEAAIVNDVVPPVEQLMADLYPALSVVRRIADQVMRRTGASRLILGIGLDCKRRQIVPANDALESDDPVWLLWACELAQRHRLEFSEKIERSIVALVEMRPVLAEPLNAGRVFTRILARTGSVYPVMQRMADLGILGWFIPEFAAIIDLIPYDPSHDHTVGQHTLLVIKNLEALDSPDGSEEQVEMKRILSELPNPEQLFLAALLHDAGKAIHGRPHAEVSDELAAVVCARLGWPEDATSNVRFLVRQHLVMAETSRLRDLNLDETIRDFTSVVDDIDRLNMLYLLTYADTRAVGEGVWSQLKGRFLRDLWRRAAGVLCADEPVGIDDASLARARRQLVKDLSLENLPEEEVAEHIEAMPPTYLLNQDLREIALHIGFIRRVRQGNPVIDFYDEREGTFTELTVCIPDDPKPGLLAKIASVLYAADVNVHSAQVMTRVSSSDRIALDTLLIDFRGRQLAPGKRREISDGLQKVLSGTITVQELLGRRKSRLRVDESRVALKLLSLRNDLSDSLTFVEVGGPDVQGGFYRACAAVSGVGWNIRSARISTWKHDARLGFYVVGAHALSEEAARRALTGALQVSS